MLHDKTKMAPTARETEDSQDKGKSTYLDEIWMHALFLISTWGVSRVGTYFRKK